MNTLRACDTASDILQRREKEAAGGLNAEFVRTATLAEIAPYLHKVPSSGNLVTVDYTNYPYIRGIVEALPELRRVFLLWGRQLYKSSTMAHTMLSTVVMKPRTTWQYVSATMKQAREFSHWKLDGGIEHSRILDHLFDRTGARRVYNLQEKMSFLDSRILIGTAFGDAARIRGNPADYLSIDELELIDYDAVPVLQECMSASDLKWELHAATPLSTENTAWIYWDELSVQYEWAVPCTHHTPVHWNVLGPENLRITGIVCDRCERTIYSLQGRWVVTKRPRSSHVHHAFRLPQIAHPRADCAKISAHLVHKPIQTLRESFALSTEESEQVFTMFTLKALERQDIRIAEETVRRLQTVYPLCAGIDWAQGGTAATTLILGTNIRDRYQWVAGYRFLGAGMRELLEIMRLIDVAKAHRIVADAGAGHMRNRILMEKYGFPRFCTCQYVDRAKFRRVLDPKNFVLVASKHDLITDLVTAMKIYPEKFGIPHRQDMEECHWWQDMLALRVEIDDKGKARYVRKSTETVDMFHGMVYAFLASDFITPRPDIMVPVITAPGLLSDITWQTRLEEGAMQKMLLE